MARSDARALDRHLHGTVAISGETANKLCVFATGKVMAELDGLRLGEVADWSVTGPEHGVLRSEFVRARLYASVPPLVDGVGCAKLWKWCRKGQ
jgi:hypothetical protein